ncbi:Ankyrin-2 [Colletotrichum fructicola]|nr:Ankyrin-2 [Colletotrichum fructicola]
MDELIEKESRILSRLTLRHEPPNPALDIVAVHGFGGDPYQSWTSGKPGERERYMWLQELPPNLIHCTRIHTFSYSSKANDAADILHPEELTLTSKVLLRAIISAKNEALLIAEATEPYRSSIAKQCRRLVRSSLILQSSFNDFLRELDTQIFFATPHRASTLASSWEDLLFNILLASPTTSLSMSMTYATQLKTFSIFIEDVSDKFTHLFPRHLINVYQQYDESKSSSPVDLQTILAEASLETHSSYRQCLSDISAVSPPSVIPDTKFDFFIREHDMSSRYLEFRNWIKDPSSRIITTSGGSGIGKGLIACALFRELQKSSLCAAYFSFSFSGSDYRRASTTQLLASVLLQLFDQEPARYSRIAGIHEAMLTSPPTAWTRAALMTIFQSILETKEGQSPLYLVIDGLHRCDESWTVLLEAFLAIFKTDRHTKIKVAIFYQEREDLQEVLDSFGDYRLQGPVLVKEPPVLPLSEDLTNSLTRCNPGLLSLTPQIQAALDRSVAITSRTADFTASFDPEDIPLDAAAEMTCAFGGLTRFEDGGIVFIADTIKTRLLKLVAESQQHDAAIPENAQITAILIGYLSWKELRNPGEQALDDLPFIQRPGPSDLAPYAMGFWSHHYRLCAPSHPELTKVLLSKLEDIASLSRTTPFLLASQLKLVDIATKLKESSVIQKTDFEKAIGMASRLGHEDVLGYLLDVCVFTERELCDLSEALRQASAHGHDNVVKKVLEHARSHERLNTLPLNALLCQAALFGYESQAKLFLEYGANVNAVIDQKTPLQHAVENGHASVVLYLLCEGKADVNPPAATETDAPIILAVAKGYQLVVEHLLRFNAETQPPPDPLMVACVQGNESIARLLLDYDANANPEPDIYKHSALYYVVRSGRVGSLVKRMFQSIESLSTLADIGEVFLLASQYGFAEIVEECLSASPAIMVDDVALASYSDADNRTALHHAAERGLKDIVVLLLDKGGEVLVDAKDESANTPLALAALAGEDCVVELLLSRGADPFLKMDSSRKVVNLVAASDSPSTEGHLASVRRLLEKGVDPNAKDDSERAPLHWAALNGKIDLTSLLLTTPGIDVDVKGRWGWNAFHFAADSGKSGEVQVSELLIHAGVDALLADVDDWLPIHVAARASFDVDLLQLLWERGPDSLKARTDDGRIALHFARGRHKALEWLLKHGSEIDAVDDNGDTTLMLSAIRGSGKAVRVLLEHGANPMLVHSEGETALHDAAYAGVVEVGEALIQFLGKEVVEKLVSHKNEDNCSALHVAIRDRESAFAEMLLDSFYAKNTGAALEDLNSARKRNDETPLITAVRNGQRGVIKKLIALGAATETRDDNGDTALLAAVASDEEDAIAITRLLLDRTTEGCADPNTGGGVHPTALYMAASQGKGKLVEELINLGANVNAVGGKYHTALTVAVYAGHAEVAEFLLEKGAAQEILDNPPFIFTPLQAAIYSDQIELVTKLLEAGQEESVDYLDSQGRTALHIAMRMGSTDMVSALIEIAAPKLDLRDKQGRSLLHHAVLSHNLEIVDICLDLEKSGYGFELSAPDNDGWTPLHWACRTDDNEEVIAALIQAARNDDVVLKATNHGWTPENICAFHRDETTKTFVDAQIKRIREAKSENEVADQNSNLENSKPGDPTELDEHIQKLEPSVNESEDLEMSKQAKESDNPKPKPWKVGYRHTGVHCDGCELYLWEFAGAAKSAAILTTASSASEQQKRRTQAMSLTRSKLEGLAQSRSPSR